MSHLCENFHSLFIVSISHFDRTIQVKIFTSKTIYFWFPSIRPFSSPCWFWVTIFSAVLAVRIFHSNAKCLWWAVRGLRIILSLFPPCLFFKVYHSPAGCFIKILCRLWRYKFFDSCRMDPLPGLCNAVKQSLNLYSWWYFVLWIDLMGIN